MPNFCRYYLAEGDSLSASEATLPAQLIPGVKALKDGRGFHVPLNAEELFRKGASWQGTPGQRTLLQRLKRWAPKEELPSINFDWMVRSGLLKPWVPDYCGPFQKEVVEDGWVHKSLLLQAPCGSGKTLGSLIWSAAYPGKTVVITGAKARPTWKMQAELYTGLKTVCLYGMDYVEEFEWSDGLVLPFADAEVLRKPRAVAAADMKCSCGASHGFTFSKTKMEENWKLVLRARLPLGQHIFNFCGTAHQRMVEEPKIDPMARLIICSWELLPIKLGQLLALSPTAVVFDESHRAKNHKRWEKIEVPESEALREIAEAKQEERKPKFKKFDDGTWGYFADKENITSAAAKLASCSTIRRRMITTATFISNRVRDAWAQLDLIEPWQWGKYWDWAKRYCAAAENGFGGMDDKGASNLEELRQRVDVVRFKVDDKEAKKHLPPLRRQPLMISRAEQDKPAAYAREIAKAKHLGGDTLREVQLAEAASRKHSTVVEKAIEGLRSGQKVVVFTARRSDCQSLGKLFAKELKKHWDEGNEPPMWIGDGSDSPEARDVMINGEWASVGDGPAVCIKRGFMMAVGATREKRVYVDGAALLVGTGEAFGESVDIQDTDLVFFEMLPFTPGQLTQWEGRFSRQGQKRPVLIYYCIAEGTYDEQVATILLDKLPSYEMVGRNTDLIGADEALQGGTQEQLLGALFASLIGGVESGESP